MTEKYVQKEGYYHYSINNPLDKYNKPLNCTDWSKEPPYNPTFKIVDDYLVKYDGDYFDLHKPSNIRSMVRIMNRIIINGDVDD